MLTNPAARIRNYLHAVRLLLGQILDQTLEARGEISTHLVQLERLASAQLAQLERLTTSADAMVSSREAQHAQLVEILRSIYDRSEWRRGRLRELRIGDAYERAYSDPDPLVSVVIPTYDNHELLRERAIPSVLAQTYQNFEVIVVGDAAPDQARMAVESFADPRITFHNRLYRGPYPADPGKRWLVAGVPAYNEAVHRSQGLWIAPLDDDDAFRPQHMERLLTRAREQRLELCYGRMCTHLPTGGTKTLGRFPPEWGEFGMQMALYHARVAEIFELDLADAAFGLPYDHGFWMRMMEADVRIGMVDEVTADYYPSRYWTPRWHENLPELDVAASEWAYGPEWEYVREGFARARSGAEPAATGWSAEDVARAYREKWPRFLEALEGPGPLGVSHEVPDGAPIDRDDVLAQNSVLAYAFALARSRTGSGPVSVLDRGGALGHFYVLARQLFPDLELDYHCRELPAVCAEGREVLPEVAFHDTDDCFERSYDLVIASNSVQYEEDWQALLRQLADATASWMFLTRVPVARLHPSFVVLQRAHRYGYATEYLGWVINRDELLDAAHDAGLELERELVLLPELTVAGAPEPFTHSGFLFRANNRP
jgi:putative methyltransferase (TIGR04325 family)